jgi:hydrogenase maturation factor
MRGRGAPGEEGGMPMRVLVLDPAGGTRARCAGTDGIPVTVETALIRPLEPGAIVLVHAGMAFARLDTEWIP